MQTAFRNARTKLRERHQADDPLMAQVVLMKMSSKVDRKIGETCRVCAQVALEASRDALKAAHNALLHAEDTYQKNQRVEIVKRVTQYASFVSLIAAEVRIFLISISYSLIPRLHAHSNYVTGRRDISKQSFGVCSFLSSTDLRITMCLRCNSSRKRCIERCGEICTRRILCDTNSIGNSRRCKECSSPRCTCSLLQCQGCKDLF